MIHQNALVKFDYTEFENTKWYDEYYKKFGNETFIFLGEIHQMPGHCIVIEMKTGKIISGYHTENFRELTEDEC